MDINAYLQDIITNFKAKSFREADRLLKLNYETVFKIRNHKNHFAETKQLPEPVCYHLGRSAGGYEVFSKLLKNYERFKIKESSDLSYFEYLEIPKPMMHEFNRTCLEMHEEREKRKAEQKKADADYLKAQADANKAEALKNGRG